jgi:hypothetical protein
MANKNQTPYLNAFYCGLFVLSIKKNTCLSTFLQDIADLMA